MENIQTILITGSNQGIGFGIIEALLKMNKNCNLIMTTRIIDNGKKAVENLAKEHQKANKITILQLDLLDKESVSNLVNTLISNNTHIDILVNNAGIAFKGNCNNTQVDITLNTNYFATRQLTETLLNKNIIRDNGKIIFISSALGKLKILSKRNPKIMTQLSDYTDKLSFSDFDQITTRCHSELKSNSTRGSWPGSVYAISKLFLSIYTSFLSRTQLIRDKNIQVNACCPGWCRTNLTAGTNAPRSIQQGAVTPVYLINLLSSDKNKFQGKFLASQKVQEIS